MNNYFATVARNLELIAARELENLGAKEVIPDFTGVHFQGDRALLYKVNLWARTIFRVLLTIETVKSSNAEQLYQSVKKIDWSEYLFTEQTLAINCTGSNQNLNHSHFTALQIKNAIIDQQREQTGKRSSIDVVNADILINAHINGDVCTLSLDSSGSSLHRRGYRPAMGIAPLKESLAAAILFLSDWHPEMSFLDPMCGSGTLAIESALISLNIAPGLYREKFTFQNWQDFDAHLWQQLIDEAKNQQKSNLSAPIFASDNDLEIIEQAQINAELCGVEKQIKFEQKELEKIEPSTDSGVIICNPPYGKRLGNSEELGSLYQLLGDIFKQRFSGWTAYILSGNKELIKKVGLRSASRTPLYNGALPCTLVKYELW